MNHHPSSDDDVQHEEEVVDQPMGNQSGRSSGYNTFDSSRDSDEDENVEDFQLFLSPEDEAPSVSLNFSKLFMGNVQ